eukprot:CAMPEP_0197524016 /NCGR_PEP_ID=MMETSP1318-20131121/8805_1 /TAXON_ID=552666 /ORGANISM="Partenskyella glossopodia, Strain RCC365" /LENGTH=301 /DNA_ID=CAMNT_0043076859 /DNA_START=541 /DNA_END=1447 /DNA_ORIENTATION=+
MPLLVGPNSHFILDWNSRMLELTRGHLDVLTTHMYTLGAGSSPKVSKFMLDPKKLDRLWPKAREAAKLVKKFPPSRLWVGEAGGAYNSGRPGASDTFASSFWFNHNLGVLASSGYAAFCRQALVGGHYALLRTLQTSNTKDTSYVGGLRPNPDFYSALLWRRLVGRGSLDVTIGGGASDAVPVRAFGFCGLEGGTVVLILNFSGERTVDVNIKGIDGSIGGKDSVEYHLTSEAIDSREIALNGKILAPLPGGEIPDVISMGLRRKELRSESSVHLAPHSIAFVKYELDYKSCNYNDDRERA